MELESSVITALYFIMLLCRGKILYLFALFFFLTAYDNSLPVWVILGVCSIITFQLSGVLYEKAKSGYKYHFGTAIGSEVGFSWNIPFGVALRRLFI